VLIKRRRRRIEYAGWRREATGEGNYKIIWLEFKKLYAEGNQYLLVEIRIN